MRYLFLDPYDIECSASSLRTMSPSPALTDPTRRWWYSRRPRPVQTLDAYYRKLWLTLDQLARLDKGPWPADIPEQVDHPMWEFSFAGEPIFVGVHDARAC